MCYNNIVLPLCFLDRITCPKTKKKMEANRINDSEFLTACLCKLQLPHTEEHVKFLPKPVM